MHLRDSGEFELRRGVEVPSFRHDTCPWRFRSSTWTLGGSKAPLLPLPRRFCLRLELLNARVAQASQSPGAIQVASDQQEDSRRSAREELDDSQNAGFCLLKEVELQQQTQSEKDHLGQVISR